tara:strand:- start:928 stop:1455 length:528 start_codon:yes stop_codon:yes gene_type:complete
MISIVKILRRTVALWNAAWSHTGSAMMSRFAHIEDPQAPGLAAYGNRMARNTAPGMAGDGDDIPGKGGDEDGGGGNGGSETGVVTRTKPKSKKPAMYKVIMLNDDYTPMEFVILVLERYFSKTQDEATQIMLHVHQKGVGVCGVFTYEVAETKVQQVMDLAKQHQHPLQCTLEKA